MERRRFRLLSGVVDGIKYTDIKDAKVLSQVLVPILESDRGRVLLRVTEPLPGQIDRIVELYDGMKKKWQRIYPGQWIIKGKHGNYYAADEDVLLRIEQEAKEELLDPMTFSAALEKAKDGEKISRKGWNGKGLFVMAQLPDEHSKMGNPYLYIDAKALGGECNPWVPSQTDLFAEDWFVVE